MPPFDTSKKPQQHVISGVMHYAASLSQRLRHVWRRGRGLSSHPEAAYSWEAEESATPTLHGTWIHPSAIVSPLAQLGANVSIGAYSIVEDHVVLGEGCAIGSHSVIKAGSILGSHCIVSPFAVIGEEAQHAHMTSTYPVIIGHHSILREHVTVHKGIQRPTLIGNHCLIMVGSHVGHDCHVGDRVIMSNQAVLAGHVVIEEHGVLGGCCAVHQFTRIGRGAMVAGFSAIGADVIPYGMVVGNRASLRGLNVVKLRRLGVAPEEIRWVMHAYCHLFRSAVKTLEERIETLPPHVAGSPLVQHIVTFLRCKEARRPLCVERAVQKSHWEESALQDDV